MIEIETLAGVSNIGEREHFFSPELAVLTMERNCIGRYALTELLDPKVLPKDDDSIEL